MKTKQTEKKQRFTSDLKSTVASSSVWFVIRVQIHLLTLQSLLDLLLYIFYTVLDLLLCIIASLMVFIPSEVSIQTCIQGLCV